MRWFGLRSSGRDTSPANAADNDERARQECTHPSVRRRKRLLEDIASFLMTHELPVTPSALEMAFDIITGANPVLTRQVEKRVSSGQDVTMTWLEEARDAEGMDRGAAQIHTLALRLEAAVSAFARSATDVRSATTDYNSALEAHVGGLDAMERGTPASIEELTGLAHAMLDTSRKMERELTRHERETRALQKSLADARRDAEIDHLTGLPNRRAFEAVFRECHAACRDDGSPLCVAFCDIDDFKRINDLHGHDAGDRVLRTVAQTLATLSDDRAHVARHGGEEFVVLLPGRSLEESCAVLDHARETMAARKLVNRATDRPFGRITFSAGVADVKAHANTREALRAADAALYKAKEAGRNKVLAATTGDT